MREQENPFIRSLSFLLVGVLSILIAFPMFMAIRKDLPETGWSFQGEQWIMFVFLLVFSLLLLKLLRQFILIILILVFGLLSYGSFSGRYGFKDLAGDYKSLLYALKFEPRQVNPGFRDKSDFKHKQDIQAATRNTSQEVREFAVSAVNANFREEQNEHARYRVLIQCFAVFKKINQNWNYVNDPAGREYFATPAESVRLLAGDCDDHAILMAACVKAIGGTARFVHTSTHLYPEILIGNNYDLEQVNYLVKKILFPKESIGQLIHYHRDESGRAWLNMDYTASYPGGRFYAEPVVGVFYP